MTYAEIRALTDEQFLEHFGYERDNAAKLEAYEAKDFELGKQDFARGYSRPAGNGSFARGWDAAYAASRR